MIKLKHTPGPWAVTYDGKCPIRVVDECGRLDVRVIQDATPSATVANHLLIAAAPDLLRELIEFHDHMIDQEQHECDGIHGGCPVKAAITKATGVTW